MSMRTNVLIQTHALLFDFNKSLPSVAHGCADSYIREAENQRRFTNYSNELVLCKCIVQYV